MVVGSGQAAWRATEAAWDTDVSELLTLVQVAPNRFRAHAVQTNYQVAIFGGQLLGQALSAAGMTVDGPRVHSVHAYFLDAGDSTAPIDYVVDELRSSAVSALRHVTAVQGERRLFTMQCFFRADQPGFDHQIRPLPAPDPERLEDLVSIARSDPDAMGHFGQFLLNGTVIEVRPFSRQDLRQESGCTRRLFWIRLPGMENVGDDALHAAMLAYLSDYWFSRVTLVSHCDPVPDLNMKFASIDHCMWFHRPVRLGDWMLYDTERPSASDGTGFARGTIFDRAGRVIASTAQEVLQVPRRKTIEPIA